MKNVIRFTVVFLSAIILSSTMIHLLSFSRKMKLSQEEYGQVQSLFRSFDLVWIVEIITLVLLAIWLFSERKTFRRFSTLLTSLFFFSCSVVLFFIFTMPANRQTQNWMLFPESWQSLRNKWEYSQAARAVLNLLGFSFLIVHLLVRKNKSSKNRYPKAMDY